MSRDWHNRDTQISKASTWMNSRPISLMQKVATIFHKSAN